MLFNKNIAVYFSVLLVPVFILQMSMNTIIYFQFKANQTYVVKSVCVNRFDPKSTCKGRCYLKSQFKKSDTDTSALQQYMKHKIDLYVVPLACTDVCAAFVFKKIYPGYAFVTLPEISIDFFHPPA